MEYGFFCMGYEIAGALGIKMAEPERDVICMVGDGAYMMANSEMATAAMMRVPFTVVLTDNRGFGCINRLQMSTGGAEFNNLLEHTIHGQPSRIDFAAHAAAMGAEAVKVSGIEELEAALARRERRRPLVGCGGARNLHPRRGQRGSQGLRDRPRIPDRRINPMPVRIGISPIAWQNDDLPDLTAAYTMEQALRESRAIGYTGVERGQRMPHDTPGLRRALEANDIALCGGWCSGNLLVNDLEDEKRAVAAQVEQFVALGAPCIVYAEFSNTVQGQSGTPVSRRPRLSRDEIHAYAARLGELARWMAGQGMQLAYHHHMGSIIENEDEVNWLMEASPREVHLLYDTGHLRFGGADELAVLDRWPDRVLHVHYKDVRPKIVDQIRASDCSFLDAVIAGAFTVPGDPEGCIDFATITRKLVAMNYAGWIVVEAEQDPAKAPPYECSRLGYETITAACRNAGLDIIR